MVKLITKKQQVKLSPTSSTKITEFPIDEPDISGGIAQINGRYPNKGYVLNRTSKELVFVLKQGHLLHK